MNRFMLANGDIQCNNGSDEIQLPNLNAESEAQYIVG